MSDEDIHSAVYCHRCGAKVKYQYPPGADMDKRDEAILEALRAHFATTNHQP